MNYKDVIRCFLLLCCIFPLIVYGATEQRLPDVSLPDITGKTYSLRDGWKNHMLLVNFWATWCAPCRKEMPELSGLQNEYKDRGLRIIGIAIDDKKSIQTYLQKYPVNYPILVAPDVGTLLSAEMGNRMGVLPFSVFVDRNGMIEFTHTGLVSRDLVTGWMKDQSADKR
ncbi:MAG TPA: TlpA family protein disulfide reductase [Crenotrichaceae bacterium]|nr:TlpA family protein disulfide reductase [Crenotrichaceae bacterium]